MARRDTQLQRALRHERKRRRLGGNPTCERCSNDRIETLEDHQGKILCALCARLEQHRPVIEWHHLAGRNNLPLVIAIPVTLHAILTDWQNDWPPEVLMNPEHDILKTLMALLLGFRDLADLVGQGLDDLIEKLGQLGGYFDEKCEGWRNDFAEWARNHNEHE
jgi:hypothetical protein